MIPEKSWILRTNVYEVNLRQYTTEGTISAFRYHLPRLRAMGVETLWFMPVTPISEKKKKGSMGSYYACSDYTGIATEFGNLEDWKSMVSEAQAMGFKVILDWVANHTGWDHRWTIEHPEWYERDPATGDFLAAHGMDDIIELDFNNSEMRTAMINAMRWWVEETGIDGFRCDLAFWVDLDFWIEAKASLDTLAPLFWLGEFDALTNPDYLQVFDSAYTWSWMHHAQEFYQKSVSRTYLFELLQQYRALPGYPAWFTSNHDENSWNGTEFEKYGAMAALLAVFSCTWPGIPLLYSGQELPNRKRLQFFEKDTINWEPENKLHGFYATLLGFRAQHPSLAADAACTILSTNAGDEVLVFLREAAGDKVLILLNFTGEARQLWLHDILYASAITEPFNGFEQERLPDSWMLGPWGYQLVALR
jgi:alpha-amylase